MIAMRVVFHGLKFELPQGWTDITDDLPQGVPPTLARPEGVGVLQFTLATYRSGQEPNVTTSDLRRLLFQFFGSIHKDCDSFIEFLRPVLSVQGSVVCDGEFVQARYYSNGRDVCLATYNCDDVNSIEAQEDLRGVGIIMNSIEF